jgi:hypothetical protein
MQEFQRLQNSSSQPQTPSKQEPQH